MTDRDISQATGKTVFISTEKFVEFRKAAIKLSRRTRAEARMHISKVANGMESNNFGLGDTNEATKEGKGEVEMTKKGSSQ